MKSRLYLETTIPSYLTSRPSRDLIIAGHQQVTRDWWEKRRGDFQIYISQLVLDEAGAGDPVAARQRLKVLQSLPLLDITPEVAELTSGILASGKIPRRAATDAAHIAIAAVHGMDFLVTWNCVHIANAAILKALASICRQHGCECPVLLYTRGSVRRRPCQGTLSSMKSGALARVRPPSTVLTSRPSSRPRRSANVAPDAGSCPLSRKLRS